MFHYGIEQKSICTFYTLEAVQSNQDYNNENLIVDVVSLNR